MYTTYADLRKELETGTLSTVEVVKEFVNKIEKGKHLNAFLSVFGDEAKERASEIDEKIRNGSAGRLAGMVIAGKDVLSIKGKRLTCGSKILENFESLYTATAIQRLLDEDVIIIGKTNCDEFAMGSSNENSAYGIAKNPYDQQRVPGGSSGGSAVAVAAGMCHAALGTDTGGSIRQPAAFCGVVGLKPTYSRVSRYGLTAFASSFDCIGPFANSSDDTGLILEIMAGWDKNDSTSVKNPVESYSAVAEKKLNISGLTIGYIDEFVNSQGLQDGIKKRTVEIIEQLKSNGFKIKEIHLPNAKYSIQTYYILTTAEASSNLARYDGARYGVRAKEAFTTEDMYVNSRTEGLGTEVKRRIMLGTYVLSAGY